MTTANTYNREGPMDIGHCKGCDRDFLPSTCPLHCGPVCCRKMACKNMTPNRTSQRYSRMVQKRCIVCGAHGDWFQKFAPCSDKCRIAAFTTAYEGRHWGCYEHHPTEKERFHVKYCCLEHYNSIKYGHLEKLRHRWRLHGRRTGKQRRLYQAALKEAGGKLY